MEDGELEEANFNNNDEDEDIVMEDELGSDEEVKNDAKAKGKGSKKNGKAKKIIVKEKVSTQNSDEDEENGLNALSKFNKERL